MQRKLLVLGLFWNLQESKSESKSVSKSASQSVSKSASQSVSKEASKIYATHDITHL